MTENEARFKVWCIAVPPDWSTARLQFWLGVKRMTKRGVVCGPHNNFKPLTAQQAFEALLMLKKMCPHLTYEIRPHIPRKKRT